MKKEKKARQTARLTKKYIDVLPLVAEGKQDYWDADLRGFMLRISPKQKTYYAVKKLLGKPVWVNLGIHGQITPDAARKRAINELSEITKGINPNKKKKQAKEKGLTLKQAFEKYLEAKPDLKDSTVRTYKVMINKNLKKWLNKPLMDITDQKIEDMFLEITKVSSKANANNSMRTFKLLYNFAKRKDKTLPDNPVQVLTAGQQWHKIGRRDTYIKDHQLKAWYDAVISLGNPYIKDYLILQLLTGMREREGLTLKWSEVDLKDRSFTILETKNREPLTLPMSDAIFDLF